MCFWSGRWRLFVSSKRHWAVPWGSEVWLCLSGVRYPRYACLINYAP
jgi:hypothetical protein